MPKSVQDFRWAYAQRPYPMVLFFQNAADAAPTANGSAWELRYALDDVNASLHDNGEMRISARRSR